MRTLGFWVVLVSAACGGGGGSPQDSGIDSPGPDAPPITPVLTSFSASPSIVPAATPTMITWTWTYGVEPTFPDPACSIDNGVGPVTRGQATLVTITSVTAFTLTCTNQGGMAQRQVIVGVPAAAPVIGTFTATPNALTVGAATNVTWAFTFSNNPSPAPTCTIEHGVGAVTTGSTTSVTQTGTRIYRLRCTNSSGSGFATATVSVDECAAGTHDCGPNSTCVNTTESFTCACNNTFVATGETCSSLQTCTLGATGGVCDPSATCVATGQGNACQCNAGFVGDGLTCQRNRIAFVTSSSGNGNLSTWTEAGGASGVVAADNICAARATAAGLPGTYKAWISVTGTDAYCRAHGQTGTKATMCGGLVPAPIAGPWVRPDGQPFAPRIDRLLAPTRQLFMPMTTEGGGAPTFSTVFTGTDENGVLTANCTDWTNGAGTGARGEVTGAGGAWTDATAADPSCATSGHLRCLQVDGLATPLPSRHPVARRIFVTSVTGNGQMSTWPDAVSINGIAGADEVCRARARFAGYTNAAAFEAMLSTGTLASSRILNTGTWVRPDGMVVATSKADLIDGTLGASLSQTETGAYQAGAADTGGAWTGTGFSTAMFATGSNCSSWTSTVSSGTIGRHDLGDLRWLQSATPSSLATCTTQQRLYCYED